MALDQEIVKFFSRHIVFIRLFLRRKQEIRQYWINTLILLSVSERWFLVTAGHYFLDAENGIKTLIDDGWEITNSQLIDSLGINPVDVTPIPFIFKINDWRIVYDEDDPFFDFAISPLSNYFQRLLSSNGVVALNEDVWEKQPREAQIYFLLGNPKDLITSEDINHISIGSLLHKVIPLSEKPEGFKSSTYPLFYGQIELIGEINSIQGESGGPIFGCAKNEKGELRYWLIALQSRWLPMSQYIAGCPIRPLGIAIREQYGEMDKGMND